MAVTVCLMLMMDLANEENDRVSKHTLFFYLQIGKDVDTERYFVSVDKWHVIKLW